MAKQTFTTGQVLTAAQMTSLQQTAMGGGSATAKTASYVLVAADAGGTVAMNAAGSTTITVNTGLFAAGDTVFIQNLGAGACTVTAGTATVSTAGSLILPQYDAGILYFTATGVSIFYDYIQAGGASPLTTKGDLYTYSTSDARLAVGTNTYVLTADSAEATGLKWAAPASSSLIGVRVQSNTTAQSIPNATETEVTFAGTENFDTNGFHDPTTNTARLTVPAGYAGYYKIYGNAQFTPAATGRRGFGLKINGTTSLVVTEGSPDASNYVAWSVSTTYYLNVGDYVSIFLYQDRGSALNAMGNAPLHIGMEKIG